MISAKFLWGNVLLGGKFQIGAKNSNFEIFESALYMKQVSMPLTPGMLSNFWMIKEFVVVDTCTKQIQQALLLYIRAIPCQHLECATQHVMDFFLLSVVVDNDEI